MRRDGHGTGRQAGKREQLVKIEPDVELRRVLGTEIQSHAEHAAVGVARLAWQGLGHAC